MLAWLELLSLSFENQAAEMKYVLSLLLLIPLVSTTQGKEPAEGGISSSWSVLFDGLYEKQGEE
jgi:hypothetical protein